MSTEADQEPDVKSNPYRVVSVILPTHNRYAYLGRAIDSVLSQTFQHYELIVVDDGSTDATPDLLSGYGDQIKVIRQRNQGVSAARNKGIRSASGEYIALLDSDDYWLPEKLEKQVTFFKAHPDARICQTQEIWIRNGKRVNPKKRHQKYSGMIFEKTLPLCLVSPSAVMIRKTLFNEVGGFDEALPACEDYDLWLRIAWKYPVYLIEAPLIVKRGGHADQLSRMPQLDQYRIQALVKILKQGCLSAGQHAAAVKILIQKCTIFADGCRKRGHIEKAEFYRNLPDTIGVHSTGCGVQEGGEVL
ncbi:MAG: glycosyltransferase family A protein [Desulfobacteraceae bacterium]